MPRVLSDTLKTSSSRNATSVAISKNKYKTSLLKYVAIVIVVVVFLALNYTCDFICTRLCL